MKNSYQSKPIPLFTRYNGEYSKLQLKLRFHFPALQRQTRQAAHSFRRNACTHHTLGNSGLGLGLGLNSLGPSIIKIQLNLKIQI